MATTKKLVIRFSVDTGTKDFTIKFPKNGLTWAQIENFVEQLNDNDTMALPIPGLARSLIRAYYEETTTTDIVDAETGRGGEQTRVTEIEKDPE